MKKAILFLCLVGPMSAQWVVNDPINTAVNTAIHASQTTSHIEILHRWAEQLENLNRQLRQLEAQLAEQRRIREVMGEPSAAGAQLVLRDLGAGDLARTVGETAAAVRRLSNAAVSLKYTAEGIFPALENRTTVGREFVRQESLYRRYGAVERQAGNLTAAQEQTDEQTAALQNNLASTLEQLRSASTQAEVDKLNVKVVALNGQLAHVDAQRRAEAEKLGAQQILNENQAAKERQDLLEQQVAEERQTFAAVAAWQHSVKLTPTNYQR